MALLTADTSAPLSLCTFPEPDAALLFLRSESVKSATPFYERSMRCKDFSHKICGEVMVRNHGLGLT